jgi:hypothetical protein
MPNNDWIPDPDGAFDTKFNLFNIFTQANGTTRGLSAGQLTELDDKHGDWSTSYDAHLAEQATAQMKAQTKNTARDAAETVMRALARIMQQHPAMTDADRAAAGLNVRDTTRTAAAAPTSRPIGVVDTSQRLRHTIYFKDENTPNSKKKPDGIMGAEIWCYLGATPPVDASLCSFVALDTSSPYVVDYEGEDAGKIAHYFIRWVNTRGEKGPWSETVSATIGA